MHDPQRSLPDTAQDRQCPFCRSPHVHTTGKVVSHSTYWRCSACGEIWNPARAADMVKRRIGRSW
jgi:ribosomal protein L37AE/L43A